MQNSQTLTNLANSAKANLAEFNNTLIEIHKQSAKSTEAELTKIYADEMSEIKSDISKELSKMTYQMQEARETILSQIKPTIIQRLLNGTMLLILTIGLILGFSLNFWLYNKEIIHYQNENNRLRNINNQLEQWQIPMNYRYEQANKTTGKKERYMLIPPKTMIQTKDGAQYLQLNYGGL